ncbi:MAG: response regulator transcription factor [Phycisphaerales bacterium]|nr:response regulator transcription factor [Phycisphaerales bacterium]MCB9856354.1 response regulator transcription factor [Phycisphaerales bacterium]MCB9864026.1 response regulator transcription factor [Phycisphaerales bacterium]
MTTIDPTVFVLDDDAESRNSLVQLLSSSDFTVKAFESPTRFLQEVSADQPGCLVLDLCMPEMNGTEVQRHMIERGQVMPTVIVTAYGTVQTTVLAMKQGAMDVIEKPYDPNVMVKCVHGLLAIANRRVADETADEAIRRKFERLTPREREVFEQMVKGQSSKETALNLGICFRTAQLHRERVFRKLEIESPVELVSIASAVSRATVSH